MAEGAFLNRPAVAVIVPCWNAARWIGETLSSVLAQESVETEIVLIDDGSADDTVEEARRVARSRVRIIRQPHAGVSQARARGVAETSSPFVQYVDADDVLLPGTLAARIAALAGSGADVAYTDWIRWEEQPNGTFRDVELRNRQLGQRPELDLIEDAWWPPGALLYRRELVERLSWRVDLPIIQDARYALDAALAGAAFIHVAGPGLRYRVRPGQSLSTRDPAAFLRDCYQSIADLHDRWRAERMLDDERRRALVRVFAGLARSAFEFDRGLFHSTVDRLRDLDPAFLPAEPSSLRMLSKWLGYPAAEHLALSWRRIRRTWRRRATPSCDARPIDTRTMPQPAPAGQVRRA